MVPRVGIEPTLLSEPDFESGASTNFTTEARETHYTREFGLSPFILSAHERKSAPPSLSAERLRL